MSDDNSASPEMDQDIIIREGHQAFINTKVQEAQVLLGSTTFDDYINYPHEKSHRDPQRKPVNT